MRSIYFCTKVAQKKQVTNLVNTEPDRWYNIAKLVNEAGEDRQLILFPHACMHGVDVILYLGYTQ